MAAFNSSQLADLAAATPSVAAPPSNIHSVLRTLLSTHCTPSIGLYVTFGGPHRRSKYTIRPSHGTVPVFQFHHNLSTSFKPTLLEGYDHSTITTLPASSPRSQTNPITTKRAVPRPPSLSALPSDMTIPTPTLHTPRTTPTQTNCDSLFPCPPPQLRLVSFHPPLLRMLLSPNPTSTVYRQFIAHTTYSSVLILKTFLVQT